MLPEGWKLGDFGSIGKWTGGGTPSKANDSFWMGGTIPWVSPKDMTSGKICDTEDHITPEAIKNSATRLYPSGSVMIVTRSGILRKKLPVAIAESPVTVNQDLKVLSYDKKFSPEYVYNYILCFNNEILNACAKDGTTVESIDTNSFLNFPVKLPPLPEQKKIAAILSTWDRAIEGTEKLLANSQQQKKALMQQLLTGKNRLPGFTGEWKRQSFKVIFDVDNQKDTQTPASKYKEEGRIPIVDQGKTFISGYTDANTVYENVPVIIFGDHTRVIKWVDFLFSPGADGTQVLRTWANTLNKFGYYLLQNVDLPNLGYSRHMKELKEQIFHCPPLPEQKAIASVLTTADEEITALESDLTRLRQEKKALMQQLLTGKRRVTVD
ncbi:restriction endonuclease subunit S [Gluconobacter wancherniae]|uniref:restriction endonuclease subunit S n=1 Tax=Gluconobacter wancherniae TaxID=1307955 RepID=UPI0030A5144A